MENEEIKEIENVLGITLPMHYVAFLMNFEGLSAEIDIENFLYSKPKSVIEINKMIGFYTNEKVVTNKLIIGDNGGGDFYLIDLKIITDERVYVFDHEESITKNFDHESNTWNWEKLEYFETIEAYKDNLYEIFRFD